MSGINFVKGKSEDFDTRNMISVLSTAEKATLTSESTYMPHFYPKSEEIPPIAKVLTLRARMHVPRNFDGEILQTPIDAKHHSEFHHEVKQNSVFDLGTSSLQRIITQMREMRRSSTKYAFKPTNALRTVHSTPDCMPNYSNYLHGKTNTSWELAKRKHLEELLAAK